MALAKNFPTPGRRAGQNYPIRTAQTRRIPCASFSVPEFVSGSRFEASDSAKAFVAQGATQGATLFAALKIWPPLNSLERRQAKPFIISTCVNQHLQLSQNQHLRIPGCKSRRMNTYRKMGGGWVQFLNLLSAVGPALISPETKPVETDLVSKMLIMGRKAYQKTVRISHLIRR